MTFVQGASYTRKQINSAVGGNLQSFLPTVRGKVVCACLTPELNPNAPNIILVGGNPEVFRQGWTLSNQDGSIPVFLKNSVNDWRYVGDYEVASSTMEKSVVEEHRIKAGRKKIVTIVIFMRKVEL